MENIRHPCGGDRDSAEALARVPVCLANPKLRTGPLHADEEPYGHFRRLKGNAKGQMEQVVVVCHMALLTPQAPVEDTEQLARRPGRVEQTKSSKTKGAHKSGGKR